MIRRCRKASRSKIRSVLDSLPKTLDATYERILSQVDDDDRDDVLKLLEWVVFAKASLSPKQLQENLAIDLQHHPLPQASHFLRNKLVLQNA
jgi:hypothetical protein